MSCEKPRRSGQWITDNKLERIFKRSKSKGVNIKKIFEKSEQIKREKFLSRLHSKQPSPQFVYMNKSAMKSSYGVNLHYLKNPCATLYICDQCLQSFDEREYLDKHLTVCSSITMPGKEIYRDKKNNISVFECCGYRDKLFCHALCILGVCFIGHKCLLQDTEPFYFYVLFKRVETENGSLRYSFIGYFSKQKYRHGCNLCCLLVMPCYHGSGYGRFLVDFSFLLSREEGSPSGPEYPLSTAADVLYSNYILDCVYMTAYKYALQKKRNDPQNKGENIQFNIQYLEDETGIGDTYILKILKQANLITISENDGNANVKFHMDMEKIIKSVKKQQNKLRAYKQLLKWEPDPTYCIDELLHFPEIEREKYCGDQGIEYEPHVEERSESTISCKFNYTDTPEEFDQKNKQLKEYRSHIFTHKDEDETMTYAVMPADSKKSSMTQGEHDEFLQFKAKNKRLAKLYKDYKRAEAKAAKFRDKKTKDKNIDEVVNSSEGETEVDIPESDYESDPSPEPFLLKNNF